ncbi:uncharacterized protein A4U43_C06F19920 [Asparagus officinalis]|uniref:Hexosyltransferase n=1 Tax=Asparagus officinalis TaxID=4686 RepID=A0A5P1EN26_ASPOF|nr:probable galacturonosyltransferase 11 [Asparagus officinalis]ONK67408.1 uncharacterized protein A4U43_C06F19920 [Asparagus officinalis]
MGGRRAGELRRPARRRRSGRICWVLGFFILALFLLFIVQFHGDPSLIPLQEIELEDLTRESLNFTLELLSTTSTARQMIDQVSLAKAYIIIAKEHGNLNLAWELSSFVRNSQGLLSESITTSKPVNSEEALPIISQLSRLIHKAQGLHYDISTTITTLKKHVKALEERAVAAVVQSAELGRLATETMPKEVHCMTLRLTEDWFENELLEKMAKEKKNSQRLVDNNLYHFCVFSDNVMSTSVLVNSTVSNAEHPQQLVFHIVTDEVNYRAMTAWFLKNEFKGCTIDVTKIEDLIWLKASYSPLVKQLSEARESKYMSPKSIVLLNHLRFYLPEMHPSLEKVVFLEDDVVVQKDITSLFTLDMHGNVIGAVETCLETSHRLYDYLNFSNPLIRSRFDPQACAWAFGINVFDLIEWKKVNATVKYHYWQERNEDQNLWKDGTLSAGLLAFYGLVEPIDRRWHVMGLGSELDIDERLIESAAAVHFTGDMKPWLRLGITRYKHLWQQYLNLTHPYVQDCFLGV